MIQFLIIDFIHDTRHLCTCFRIAGIKAMSHGISGDRQVIKFAITRNRRRIWLFSWNETTTLVMQNLQFEFRQDLPALTGFYDFKKKKSTTGTWVWVYNKVLFHQISWHHYSELATLFKGEFAPICFIYHPTKERTNCSFLDSGTLGFW